MLDPKFKYYPFLDGLRAFAVIWVLLHHFWFKFGIDFISNDALFWFVFRICELGFLGVDIFFVISGFLITGLLIDELNSSVNIKRFYLRRAFKIIPHYFFILVVGIILSFSLNFQENYSTQSILSYFLFFQNYVQPIEILSHLWSIAIEEHFYFVYPLLLTVLCFSSRNSAKRKQSLVFIFIFLVVLANFLRFRHFAMAPAVVDHTYWQYTHIRFDALISGCLLKIAEPFIVNLKEQKQKSMGLLAFVVCFSLFTLFIFKYSKINWLDYTLVYIASCALIISSLCGFNLLNKILERKTMIWIGKNSYGIYLWHYVIQYPVLSLFGERLSNAWLFFLSMVLSILLGILTTQTIEKYYLNIRNRIIP